MWEGLKLASLPGALPDRPSREVLRGRCQGEKKKGGPRAGMGFGAMQRHLMSVGIGWEAPRNRKFAVTPRLSLPIPMTLPRAIIYFPCFTQIGNWWFDWGKCKWDAKWEVICLWRTLLDPSGPFGVH